MLEYLVMAVLLTAGLVITGPYIIRSWNANMKSWEVTARDSVNDPLVEPSVPGTPPCTCQELLGGAPNTCGFGECGLGEYLKIECGGYQNCEETRTCVVDPGCCTKPINFGGCGEPCPGGLPCADTEVCAGQWCGSDIAAKDPTRMVESCITSPACVFSCTGSFKPLEDGFKEELCTPAISEVNPGAFGFVPFDRVNNGDCTVARPCEVQCRSYGDFAFVASNCSTDDPLNANNDPGPPTDNDPSNNICLDCVCPEGMSAVQPPAPPWCKCPINSIPTSNDPGFSDCGGFPNVYIDPAICPPGTAYGPIQ